MTLATFVLKNALRSPRRTLLTVASIAVSLSLVVILRTIMTEIMRGSEASAAIPRIVVRHRTSLAMSLPTTYGQKIAKVPGIKAVTPLNWFGGIYKDQNFENFFPRFATDPDTFFQVFTDYPPSRPEYVEAFKAQRTACMVGERLMNRFGWKIGDKINITGDIYAVNLELVICGTYTGEDSNWMVFRRDYLDELRGRPTRAGTFFALAEDPREVPKLLGDIQALFRNAESEVKAETEQAFQLSFVEMIGNIKVLISGIVSVVVFAILIICASTMAMAIRERTREIAVLKTLGYPRRTILLMIVAEGMLVTSAGGILGVGGSALVLPRPKWFLAILAGVAITSLLGLALLLVAILLPERTASDTRYRISTWLQHVLWEYGPVLSIGAGLVVSTLLFCVLPPIDWIKFSKGYFQGLMIVQSPTVWIGTAIALAVGLFSSILPAWNASRQSVLDGLRHVG